jgi:hypothetical protein
MKTTIRCSSCKEAVDIDFFFDQCMTSIPEASALVFSCTHCGKESAYTVTPEQILPERSSKPVKVSGLRAQAHANYFHVWYLERHWAIEHRHNVS